MKDFTKDLGLQESNILNGIIETLSSSINSTNDDDKRRLIENAVRDAENDIEKLIFKTDKKGNKTLDLNSNSLILLNPEDKGHIGVADLNEVLKQYILIKACKNISEKYDFDFSYGVERNLSDLRKDYENSKNSLTEQLVNTNAQQILKLLDFKKDNIFAADPKQTVFKLSDEGRELLNEFNNGNITEKDFKEKIQKTDPDYYQNISDSALKERDEAMAKKLATNASMPSNNDLPKKFKLVLYTVGKDHISYSTDKNGTAIPSENNLLYFLTSNESSIKKNLNFFKIATEFAPKVELPVETIGTNTKSFTPEQISEFNKLISMINLVKVEKYEEVNLYKDSELKHSFKQLPAEVELNGKFSITSPNKQNTIFNNAISPSGHFSSPATLFSNDSYSKETNLGIKSNKYQKNIGEYDLYLTPNLSFTSSLNENAFFNYYERQNILSPGAGITLANENLNFGFEFNYNINLKNDFSTFGNTNFTGLEKQNAPDIFYSRSTKEYSNNTARNYPELNAHFSYNFNKAQISFNVQAPLTTKFSYEKGFDSTYTEHNKDGDKLYSAQQEYTVYGKSKNPINANLEAKFNLGGELNLTLGAGLNLFTMNENGTGTETQTEFNPSGSSTVKIDNINLKNNQSALLPSAFVGLNYTFGGGKNNNRGR